MSAPFLLLISIGTAAILWSACFIGCDVVLGLEQITDCYTYQSTVTSTASGYVSVSSPIPLYISRGRPDLPTPLLPFNGFIQDVAFYDVVLDGKTIETHYLNCSGMQMS